MLPAPSQITHLLHRWGEGDSEALDQLIPLIYERMRQLAHQQLKTEMSGSLNTTALVHEAYLKLVDSPYPDVRDRGHFVALASRVMRHLLVDHARARDALKRGAGSTPLELDEMSWMSDTDLDAVNDLHLALQRLELMNARQSQILEQCYFGGLTLEEIADGLDTSLSTVKRELRLARAWLAAELQGDSS